MLDTPKHGWVKIKIGEYEDRASYLNDVPNDLLDVLIHGYESSLTSAITFDAEGWTWTVVISDYDMETYIISNKDGTPKLYTTGLSMGDFSRQVVDDIERDIDAWANFVWDDNRDVIEKRKKVLIEKIERLKTYCPYKANRT